MTLCRNLILYDGAYFEKEKGESDKDARDRLNGYYSKMKSQPDFALMDEHQKEYGGKR